MVICWDGRVVPCCRDFDAKYILGDLNDSTLLQIWNGAEMVRLRKAHTSSVQGIDLCQHCNQTSFVDSPVGILFTALRRRMGLA
jgi:radical SAM protein with 4Fe4S-binding SPASM domain